MGLATPLFGLVSLILIAGASLLIFLTLLGGGIDKNPTNQYYFLEADTANIGNAAGISRWTFWSVCNALNGRNVCPKVRAAYPFDPVSNFAVGSNTKEVPSQFVGTKRFYLLTRFSFAFVLIALFFSVITLFTGLLALCSRIGSFISSGLTIVAFVFQALSASLMTAAFVQGRNAFRSAGRTATLGRSSFGFMWAATACLFLATLLLCIGGSSAKKSTTGKSKSRFGRKKAARDRGSFIDRSSFEKGERPTAV